MVADKDIQFLKSPINKQEAIQIAQKFGGGGSTSNKGYFVDETALTTAYPTGQDGWYAILGSTDTVWVWDSGTAAWIDTDNGANGDVVGPASSTNNNIAVFDGTTGKLLKDGGATIASKQDVLGFTPENVSNKATDFTTVNDTLYPSVEAVNEQLALKEDSISAGTTSQYFRGDKTFQTLDKAAVGLSNVDNTSDADKPVSTAQQTALDLKQDQDNLLDGISTLSGNGIVVRVNANTAASRSIVAGSSKITVTNGDGTSSNPSIDIGSGIDAASIANGSVSNTEFQYINSLSSNAQTQLDSKLDHTGGTITDYAETVSDVTATATTSLDINNGNVFNLTQAVNITTLNFNNAATTGKSSSFTLIRTKDATTTDRTIAWPASVKWSAGLVPALSTSSSAVDIFTFMTIDGGTTWYGFLGGQNFS